MKKLLFMVVLLLGSLLTTGFTYDPGTQAVQIEDDSTTTLKVLFENPNIVISDQRTGTALLSYFQTRDTLISTIIGYIESRDILDQERRDESFMDYLSRKTGQPPDMEIEGIIDKHRKKVRNFPIYYAFTILTLFLMWWKNYNNRVTMNQEKILALIGFVLLAIVIYIFNCAILKRLEPPEYQLYLTYLNST